MSQIIKAIKRIGIVAQKRNRKNLPATLVSYFPPYESVRDATPENLTPKQLKLVNQY